MTRAVQDMAIGMVVFVVVIAGLSIVIGNFVAKDRAMKMESRLLSDEFTECFEDDRYIKALEESVTLSRDKLVKMKTDYYISCINDIRNSK